MEIDTAPAAIDTIIHLNVGGKLYTTSKSTLTKYSDTMLCIMFDGDIPSTKDAQGNVVIDRDGEIFRFVLTFLRCGKLILPDNFTEFALLEEEAEFYQIQPLIEAVKECRQESSVNFNVGGKLYTISRKTLAKYPESLLYKITEKDTIIDVMKRDDKGNITIHRDGDIFRFLLTFLECGELMLPNNFTYFKLLEEEAQFYRLPQLCDAVKKAYDTTEGAFVMLNVGGKVFPVHLKYLVYIPKLHYRRGRPDHTLDSIWNMIRKSDAAKDQNGNYLIDGNPELFGYILHFVRTGKFYLPVINSETHDPQVRHSKALLQALAFELNKLEIYNIDLRSSYVHF